MHADEDCLRNVEVKIAVEELKHHKLGSIGGGELFPSLEVVHDNPLSEGERHLGAEGVNVFFLPSAESIVE